MSVSVGGYMQEKHKMNVLVATVWEFIDFFFFFGTVSDH